MLIAISKIEMEQSLSTAAMFGMKQNDIDVIRQRFENEINTSPQDIKPNLKEDIRLIEATGGTITKIPRKK